MSDIDQAFQAFHSRRPEVYEYLREVALRFKSKGHSHISIKLCYEFARCDAYLSGRATKMWELSNNFTASYSRLLMSQEPELLGFFRTRKLKDEPYEVGEYDTGDL